MKKIIILSLTLLVSSSFANDDATGLTEIELLNQQAAFTKQLNEAAQKATASINKLRQESIRDGLFDSYGTSQKERNKYFEDYARNIEYATSKGEDIGDLTTKLIEQIQPTQEAKAEIIKYATAFSKARAEMLSTSDNLDAITNKIKALKNTQ